MPGGGKTTERAFSAQESEAISKGAAALGLSSGEVKGLLGESTLDIYLNENVFWSNVPKMVWDYLIGGYQVIKKWLSYRDEAVLGRSLTPDEVREVTEMVRRIAAILLLQPKLDENFEAVKAKSYDWKAQS